MSEKVGSAVDVAAAVIEKRPNLDQMQLHKLLYLVQASSLAWFETPAFVDPIQAWIYGPVTRTVAGHYKQFGDQPITKPVSGDSDQLSERIMWVVGSVIEAYGGLDGFTLAGLLKDDPDGPWRRTRGDLSDDEPSDVEIPTDLIAEHHRHNGLPGIPGLTSSEHELAQKFFDGDPDALAELFERRTGVRPTVR